jgi:hypothetical protein
MLSMFLKCIHHKSNGRELISFKIILLFHFITAAYIVYGFHVRDIGAYLGGFRLQQNSRYITL